MRGKLSISEGKTAVFKLVQSLHIMQDGKMRNTADKLNYG